jgi:hypothetical protein
LRAAPQFQYFIKVAELKKALQLRGLSVDGLKAELQKQLQETMTEEDLDIMKGKASLALPAFFILQTDAFYPFHLLTPHCNSKLLLKSPSSRKLFSCAGFPLTASKLIYNNVLEKQITTPQQQRTLQ